MRNRLIRQARFLAGHEAHSGSIIQMSVNEEDGQRKVANGPMNRHTPITRVKDGTPADFGGMLDSITDGFMSVDSSWRFLYVNRSAERLLRRPRSELLGKDFWDCYPDLVGSGYHLTYRDALESGVPRTHTAFYPPLATWFEARAFPHEGGLTILFRDVTLEHDHKLQLAYQAGHDSLTGLPNRRRCMEVLSAAVASASADPTGGTQGAVAPGPSEDAELAVLWLDLDRFKEVNDAFGHATGDKLLCDVARRLANSLPPSVFAARVGGDEFVLVLRRGDVADAQTLASAVIEALAAPFTIDGHSISLGACAGIALIRTPGETAEALLRRADLAMYSAKSMGYSQFCVYSDALERGLQDRVALRGDLRQAFDRDEFELHFQPQFALATGALIGAEALLRWRHPTRGLLAPGTFLDLILDSPMEAELALWVIREACRLFGQWLARGVPVPRLSFNLSARQLMINGLADTVVAVAQEHGVPTHRLDVEVTENALMSDIDRASVVLGELKQHGVSTSLDDFGSGYSSLAYLVRLPIDTLKIDKSFVWAIGKEPKAETVITGILTLARSLGMMTVAEGVENESQYEVLARLGCDAVQGYFLCRPLAPTDFPAFVLMGPTK